MLLYVRYIYINFSHIYSNDQTQVDREIKTPSIKMFILQNATITSTTVGNVLVFCNNKCGDQHTYLKKNT